MGPIFKQYHFGVLSPKVIARILEIIRQNRANNQNHHEIPFLEEQIRGQMLQNTYDKNVQEFFTSTARFKKTKLSANTLNNH